ncbi:MAG: DUF4249 family protein [Bacteroidota bacterium]|nr:DUF4249 family protein [Bacteroidota bacterium]
MKKILAYILLLIFLAGCSRKTDWPVSGNVSRLIAVDGILTDQEGIQVIKLTRPVSQLNETPQPLTGATVLVSNEDSVWTLTEKPDYPGNYQTPSYFFCRVNKNYNLKIYYGKEIYTAKTYMVPGTVFNELRYARNDDDELYHIDFVASAFTTGSPAMWEILIDWSNVSGFKNKDSLSTHARLLFYTLPTLDVTEIFAPVAEKISFPAGSIIDEKRYSLNPAHAEYIRELLLETTWQGGLFPTENANVQSNLSSGAVGFFGTCAVTELSLIVAK